jgi:hypothetical protein
MLGAALIVTLAWIGLRLTWWTDTGLSRTVFTTVGFAGESATDRAARIDLDFMNRAHGPRRYFSARWLGVWLVERAGAYELLLAADDWARVSLDGEPLLVAAPGAGTARTTRTLSAGAHAIVVDYEQEGGHAFLSTAWAPAGGRPRAFDASHLFPSVPRPEALGRNALVRTLGRVAAVLWIVAAIIVVVARLRRIPTRPGGVGALLAAAAAHVERRAGLLATSAAVLVVLLAAALRFEAICTQYGPFDRPAWLYELEAHTRDRIGAIRPDIFAWRKVDQPYVGGDPVNYIRFAREMKSFYAAHVREPVFPFVTRLWLPLVDSQDVAVSFASASFSLLAVWATYLLGAAAYSRGVGLLAALGLAIDKDMATWGADGWRDDALTAFVVLWAWALVRSFRSPSPLWSIALGVIGAGAMLTRITALSFILPSLALLVLWPRATPLAARLRASAIAAVVAAALVAPYLVNCWRTFGDPLYAINYHTAFYRARSGQPFDRPMSTASYLAGRWRQDPAGTIELVTEGLTTYPFGTKWIGFDFWYPGLGRVLKWAALAGVIVMAASATGCVLLVVLITSLLPYAFTWNIPGGAEWRFTMHAYPFYLIAAGVFTSSLVGLAWRRLRRQPSTALN